MQQRAGAWLRRGPGPAAQGAAVKASVVIPVFNERKSLPLVVSDLPRGLVHEIVVIDNASTDGTALVARDLPVRLVSEPRRGYGRACLAGVAAILVSSVSMSQAGAAGGGARKSGV